MRIIILIVYKSRRELLKKRIAPLGAERHRFKVEVIMISGEKLKVMLSSADMEYYAISCDMLDSGNTESRCAFRKILEDARGQCGFDAAGARVFVQVFPSKEGGCEMFVTKLGESAKIGLQAQNSKKFFYVYSFDCLNKMLEACAVIHRLEYSDESFAYTDTRRKRYFLMLETDIPNLSEFGGRKCRSNVRYYISEHCSLICAGAVDRLSDLA